MRKLLKNKASEVSAAEEYSLQKDRVQELSQRIAETKEQETAIEAAIDEVKAELDHLTASYESHGGVTAERWKELQQRLRDEEQLRDQLNIQRKQMAESVLPFMIVTPLLEKVKEQIKREESYSNYLTLKNVLQSSDFLKELSKAAASIGSVDPKEDGKKLFHHVSDFLLRDDWSGFSPILSLSDDDAAACMTMIMRAEETDQEVFSSLKTELDQSIERSRKIRSVIESSSVDTLESYLEERFRLQEAIEKKTADHHQLHTQHESLTNEYQKEKCCYYLKEKPCTDWARENNSAPYLGLMASEGGRREKALMLHGCNYFGKDSIRSAPFAIFYRQDLLQLALDLNVPVPEVYGEIKRDDNGLLFTTGEQRTGCSMCGFGIQMESRPHRFDRLRMRSPKEWDYWMNRCCQDDDGTLYGWGRVLDYIGVGWRDIPEQFEQLTLDLEQ